MDGRFGEAHHSGQREDEHGRFCPVEEGRRKALAGSNHQQFRHRARPGQNGSLRCVEKEAVKEFLTGAVH
jgi:hypothetical protein